MHRFFMAAFTSVLIAGSAAAEDGSVSRFWTDNTGTFSTRARLLAVDQIGRAVTLLLVDGDQVVVPFRRLSGDDLAWLKQHGHTAQPTAAEISGIRWFADLRDARAVAAGEKKLADDKPIMCFRALGDLSGFM